MSILKTALSSIVEGIGDDFDDDALATGRTAYKPSPRLALLRARKEELEQLRRELGREPTQDEVDLIFGDLDPTDPVVPRTVAGDYGRQEDTGDEFDTRRAERGPTARRFKESAANSAEQLVEDRGNERGPLLYTNVDMNYEGASKALGSAIAWLASTDAGEYIKDALNDGADADMGNAVIGLAEMMIQGLSGEGDDSLGALMKDGNFNQHVMAGVHGWVKAHRDRLDAFEEEVRNWHDNGRMRERGMKAGMPEPYQGPRRGAKARAMDAADR